MVDQKLVKKCVPQIIEAKQTDGWTLDPHRD